MRWSDSHKKCERSRDGPGANSLSPSLGDAHKYLPYIHAPTHIAPRKLFICPMYICATINFCKILVNLNYIIKCFKIKIYENLDIL